MNDRRRFLRVLGASVVVAGCGHSGPTIGGNSGTAGSGGSGAGGDGNGAGPGGMGAGGDPENVCGMTGKNIVNVGSPSDYPDIGLHKAKTRVLIGRDENGLYALSSICNHMQCDMNTPRTELPGGEFIIGGDIMPDGGIMCYCHGSRYTADGNVEMGPSVIPLDAYAISLCDDGTLQVDIKSIVDPSFRLPV